MSIGLHYGTISADDDDAYDAVFGDTIDDYSITLSTSAAGLGIDFSLINSMEAVSLTQTLSLL
ncbi:MAG: hypothetical protein CM15mP51_16280 [Porticoccaceae bacterium]|nr:MAG: hypothetical protein CM15mP51_16280 [Porticoccaceae bacterium]